MVQSPTDNTLLDQLKTFQVITNVFRIRSGNLINGNFQSESTEWEKAAEFLSESLQKLSQDELNRIAQSLDQNGKINTIEYDLKEQTGNFAESLYIVGNNENITSRTVSRPSKGELTNPMTETSEDALNTLSTVERLQIELLDTEDRAINAEKMVEDLEERVRELERAMSRGNRIDNPPKTLT